MPAFPIEVPLCRYSGHDPAKLRKADTFNRLAKKIEDYINDRVRNCDDEIQTFYYGNVARELRVAEDDVCNVLFGVGGGNGITVMKR